MNDFDELRTLCLKLLADQKLNENYSKRLNAELKEIYGKDGSAYFLEIYEKKEKYENEHNLLVPYLLGICDEFDIEKPPASFWDGDAPDVDQDFERQTRTWLKETYAHEQFGKDFVCNIATYTTFGLRSALIDMAKVFGLDRKEILSLTTRLAIKDDEGEVMTWDKALELYDDLRIYLEKHKEMAEAVKRILHRNKNMGMHASGLIISGVSIKDFVPLVRVRNNEQACSAWGEGLQDTALGAVGLVKFDFLSLDANMKIAEATHIIGGKVCALPGKSNWSDTRYLNDPAALKMANDGDLKMIFQYDGSDGIRRLAKQGGVTSFNDLAAYTALYRPSCIKFRMHESYCNRKNGKEEYEIHPKLSFLNDTYGVMVFQEQIMRILNVVGKIPLKDCEAVRKAISKKKIERFKKYKDMFITNGQEVLGYNEKEITGLWNNVEAFSGYGFGMGHCVAYTYISARMLYLKARHPLAFYSAVISHTDAACPKDYQKLKGYKSEAQKHGITVNAVHLNKSGFNCKIIDNQIYYGFSKIKGIGAETAQRIVNLQPYVDYKDFVKRFGTEAKVNQALIALRIFDGDPIALCKYYESYKTYEKKRADRRKRHEKAMEKYNAILKETTDAEELASITNKMNTTIKNYESKIEEFHLENVLFANPDYVEMLKTPEKAEETYYGFAWTHRLEKCKHYNHHTLEEFTTKQNAVGPIDVYVEKVELMHGPKATYYKLTVEDVSGVTARITIWTSDYEKFSNLLVKGACLRLQVNTPTEGFNSYTLARDPNRFRKFNKMDMRVFNLE